MTAPRSRPVPVRGIPVRYRPYNLLRWAQLCAEEGATALVAVEEGTRPLEYVTAVPVPAGTDPGEYAATLAADGVTVLGVWTFPSGYRWGD